VKGVTSDDKSNKPNNMINARINEKYIVCSEGVAWQINKKHIISSRIEKKIY
jgi:hypothetical protein